AWRRSSSAWAIWRWSYYLVCNTSMMKYRSPSLLLLCLLLTVSAGAASKPPFFNRAMAAITTPEIRPGAAARELPNAGERINLAYSADFYTGASSPWAKAAATTYRKRLGLGLAIGGTALLVCGAVALHIDAANEDHRRYSGVQKGRSDYHL